MARIKGISYDESEGRLREIYNDIIQKRGKLAEVHAIQCLRPESIVHHMDLYMDIMYRRSKLSRAERELIAVIVSMPNDCDYCIIHHKEALQHYWGDEKRMQALLKDFRSVEMNKREWLLCNYAEVLTSDPTSTLKRDMTSELKAAGLSDSEILDATLIIAYFNFVNRIVLSLDVNLEADHGKGYKF